MPRLLPNDDSLVCVKLLLSVYALAETFHGTFLSPSSYQQQQQNIATAGFAHTCLYPPSPICTKLLTAVTAS